MILVAGGLLSATLQAQDAKIADASAEETKEEAQTEQKEKEGISTPRKIAGFGVLAFLIGWMIWRNAAGRNAARQEEEPEQEPVSPPTEEEK